MRIISDLQQLHTGIREAAFSCIRCGTCCQETEPGSNLVLVSPDEVRRIMNATSLSFDEIAEPYPDTIREGEKEYTLGWAVRREGNRCRFFISGLCEIYNSRPWICRTYPFMLDNGNLLISPCNGIGTEPSGFNETPVVDQLITDLNNRQNAERTEEERIAEVLSRITVPAGRLVVIDGEGMRIING